MNQRMLESSSAGPSLEQLTVAYAMHPGVVTCPVETPLPTVARMMAMYRIHAVIVFSEDRTTAQRPSCGASSPISTSSRRRVPVTSRTAPPVEQP